MSEKKLTPKQDRFCREYVIDLNATQAAIRAGYSKKTAGAVGFENLKKPEIAARIAEAVNEANKKVGLSADRVFAELSAIGHFDPATIAGKCSKPEDIADLPEEVRKAVAGWSWDANGNFVVKIYDKHKSLDLIGKHLALWVERHDHQHSGDFNFNMVLKTNEQRKKRNDN